MEELKNGQQKIVTSGGNQNQLAEKYEHLAKLANSQPKRPVPQNAANFRYQAKMLEIKAGQ